LRQQVSVTVQARWYSLPESLDRSAGSLLTCNRHTSTVPGEPRALLPGRRTANCVSGVIVQIDHGCKGELAGL